MSIATDNIKQTESSQKAYDKALEYGLKLTSGYRSPEKNASIGGSKTSNHMDGTAYDFAGSTSAMDKFAKWAQSSGLFSQVLWKVAGHYDHVHVAWNGSGASDSHSHDTGEAGTPSDNLTMTSTIIYGVLRTFFLIILFILMITFFIDGFGETRGGK